MASVQNNKEAQEAVFAAVSSLNALGRECRAFPEEEISSVKTDTEHLNEMQMKRFTEYIKNCTEHSGNFFHECNFGDVRYKGDICFDPVYHELIIWRTGEKGPENPRTNLIRDQVPEVFKDLAEKIQYMAKKY